MPIQNDNLVMVGLGVLNDQPPNLIQPPLADGIHLRFAFARERGFPWHGYYIFRRPHPDSRPLCLGSQFKPEWKVGAWSDVRADFARGVFSSDAKLVFTDQFTPSGRIEFDLRRRKYLRFELPAAETAREFHVKIGLIGEADHNLPNPKKQCIDFAGLKPGRYSNPYLSAKVEFTAFDSNGTRSKQIELQVIGGTPSLFSTGQILAKLPAASSSVELNLIVSESTAQILALDAREKIVDQKILSAQPGKTQTITLSGGTITSIKLIAAKAGFLLQRVCYTVESDERPQHGPIRLKAFHEQVPVAEAKISGYAGDIVTAVLSADLMTSIEIEGGAAALIDICTVPISQNLALGWEPLINQPLCLPAEHNNYPCPGKPSTFAQAESMALGRIHYGDPAIWGGQRFNNLNEVLNDLVALGPSGSAMADITKPYPSSILSEPGMPAQNLLDLLLVGSLDPAIAMMLGLYWVDSTAQTGVAYDYMVMADHSGRFHGNPTEALAALAAVTPQADISGDVDVWVTFNIKKESAPPLKPPLAPQVFALPGSVTGPSTTPGARNMAGLRWQLDAAPDGTLLPGEPIGYHLWRCNVGANPPTAAPSPINYSLLTAERLIIATETSIPTGTTRERASDWPSFPLMAFDSGLDEGWHSYRLSAVDIFGRHSAMSEPGPWLQWAWPLAVPPKRPAPKPWYYVDPPVERQVNPYAVRLLDKSPPPRVPGVEASALDPDDTMLMKDPIFFTWWNATPTGWWNSPNKADRNQKLGLRVCWRWTKDQMLQAPDTTEFRIYFNPGTEAPASEPLCWQDRIYVVGYNKHVSVTNDNSGNPVLREYEVLLPIAGGSTFAGVSLAPSDTEPIVYAHIGVSAADGKQHTDDDPKWSAGDWGNHPGNEGLVGTPAKIYRVLRSKPPAPPAVDESEKVWATRADYHSLSYYTFRWTKSASHKTHIFRALDDTLFQVDWERRAQNNPPLDPATAANFPIASWNQPTRDAIAAELNSLTGNGSFNAATRATYEALSNNALRTLAGLPGNEKAFSQITYAPLDSSNADRAGPDGADDYVPSATLCAYLAELDGRARNRYFFRAAYVNAAHTVGQLGVSSPPVYLPKVVPPKTPVVTKIRGDERQIELHWLKSREADLTAYRIYRSFDAAKAQNIRTMDMIIEIPAGSLQVSVQQEVTWIDTNAPVGVDLSYRVTALDSETPPNESRPSKVIIGKAIDTQPPTIPVWGSLKWVIYDPVTGISLPLPALGSIPVGFKAAVSLEGMSDGYEVLAYRKEDGAAVWSKVPKTTRVLPDGSFAFLDVAAQIDRDYLYRCAAINQVGLASQYSAELAILVP